MNAEPVRFFSFAYTFFFLGGEGGSEMLAEAPRGESGWISPPFTPTFFDPSDRRRAPTRQERVKTSLSSLPPSLCCVLLMHERQVHPLPFRMSPHKLSSI